MLKAKYLKAATKEYFKGVLSSMKWYIPASVGVIILGAVALQAADDEAPDEESTNEEASDNTEAVENENFETKEKSWFKEE